MTKSHKVIFNGNASKEMCITNFILGKEVFMFRSGIEVVVKLIQTSTKGYNLLMINTNKCVFPSARNPCKYTRYQEKGTIPIAHVPGYVFYSMNKTSSGKTKSES